MLGYRHKEKLIKTRVPAFSLKLYYGIAIVISILVFIYFLTTVNIYLATMYSSIVLFAFDFAFEFIYMLTLQQFTAQYLPFVSSFLAAVSVTKSPVTAIKYCIEYTKPPLKGILQTVCEEYDAGTITASEFFNQLSSRLPAKLFKQFFALISIIDETGADLIDICQKILANNLEIINIAKRIRGSILVGFGVLGLMIFMNLLLFNVAIQNDEIASWLFTTNRQDVFFNMVAILIALLTPKILVNWSEPV